MGPPFARTSSAYSAGWRSCPARSASLFRQSERDLPGVPLQGSQKGQRLGSHLIGLGVTDIRKHVNFRIHTGVTQDAREALCTFQSVVADVAVPLMGHVGGIAIPGADTD